MHHALHSFQFRVHTPVFTTLFVILFGTVLIWTLPATAPSRQQAFGDASRTQLSTLTAR